MLFMLFAVVLALAAFGIAAAIHFGYEQKNAYGVGSWVSDTLPATVIVFVIGVVILGIFSLVMSLETVATARDLETFYNDNHGLFLEATIEMKEGVRDSGGDNQGFLFFDAARKDHITIYNGQVQEYKKNVLKYNQDLRRHMYWQDHIVFSLVYANIHDLEVKALPTLSFPKS